MAQRKSGCRFGQGCPASLSMAKSAEAEKAGATQHSAKQRSQAARRLSRSLPAAAAYWSSSGNADGSYTIADVRCTLIGMQLTRERIVAAAVELIEREGVDAVSMRRLAAELGSGVMSLYNHVPSKDALLDGVAEQVMSGIDFSSEPGAGWEDQVRAQARAFRQIARAHPRCTMVVVSRPNASATGLRP